MKAQKYQIAMPVTSNHLAMGQSLWFGEKCCIVHMQSRPAPLLEVLLTTPTSHGRLKLQVERSDWYQVWLNPQWW